jgi:nucleoside-diphosphate-sugar epimerase
LNVLVTGAGGFLGRYVVAALLGRGHRVRALIRPTTRTDDLAWADRVDVFRSDLRALGPLDPAFDGMDVLVHLAARVGGSDGAQMADTVVGTERLLEAMARSTTRRLVLASSFSVYGWSAIRGTLTEESPLETDLYRRDGYAIAKTWQERIVRRMSQEHDWDLTVLRPGFIWGRGHEYLAGLGQKLGRWHLVFGPSTRLPMTCVENCADCFVEVVHNPRAIGGTFNVIDGHEVSSWRYLGEYLRRTGAREHRIPVPYTVALTGSRLADWVNRRLCRSRARLPGLLIPCRFLARFKPLRFSTRKLEEVLGWRPPLDLAECLRRTYDAESTAWLPGSTTPAKPQPELHNA